MYEQPNNLELDIGR